jgi:hypothetical protein
MTRINLFLRAVTAAAAVIAGVTAAADDPPKPAPTDQQKSPATDQPKKPTDRRGGPGDRDHDHFNRELRRPGLPSDGQPRGKDLPPLSLEQRIELLKQIDPDLAQKLQEGLSRNRDRVEHMMREQWPRFQELVYLKRTDPELFDLRVKDFRFYRDMRRMAGEYDKALKAKDDSKAKSIEASLRDLLTDRFEVRQKIREHELARLTKHLEDLKAEIGSEASAKDHIIQGQLDRTLHRNKPSKKPAETTAKSK